MNFFHEQILEMQDHELLGLKEMFEESEEFDELIDSIDYLFVLCVLGERDSLY